MGGDLVDFWEISKFNKVPKSRETIFEDIEFAHGLLKELRVVCPKSRIVYTFGNHCDRLRQYILENAPLFYGYEELTLRYMLRLNELGVETVEPKESSANWNGCSIVLDGVRMGHLKKVSKHSAATVKGLMDDRCVSVVQGHVHRLGLFCRTLDDGKVIWGVEAGCLCRLDPEYVDHANWQQGWVDIIDGRPFIYPYINL
jgi:hypothetical protein